MVCDLLLAHSNGWGRLGTCAMLNCPFRLPAAALGPVMTVGSCYSEVDYRLGTPISDGSCPTHGPFLT